MTDRIRDNQVKAILYLVFFIILTVYSLLTNGV